MIPETTNDKNNLSRFITAQEETYKSALAEIKAGQKRTHWMWFIFPQLKGLGHSSMASHYGISGADEARAYLAHEVLGPRLIEVNQVMLLHKGQKALDILGSPDHFKLRSSATLFSLVAEKPSVFDQVIEQFCGGQVDVRTVELLDGEV